jgi:hypothetical protein
MLLNILRGGAADMVDGAGWLKEALKVVPPLMQRYEFWG